MRFISIVLAFTFSTATLFAMPAQILLIRHGEKPAQGNQLSKRGWERSQALPFLFTNRTEFTSYGIPVALYAMAPEKQGGSIRAIQTLKYVSEIFKLPIETSFTRDEVKEVVDNINSNRLFDGKTIVLCWEHKVLVDMAHALGVSKKLIWPKAQFDRVWVLDFSPNGDFVSFKDLPQKLLPNDSPY